MVKLMEYYLENTFKDTLGNTIQWKYNELHSFVLLHGFWLPGWLPSCQVLNIDKSWEKFSLQVTKSLCIHQSSRDTFELKHCDTYTSVNGTRLWLLDWCIYPPLIAYGPAIYSHLFGWAQSVQLFDVEQYKTTLGDQKFDSFLSLDWVVYTHCHPGSVVAFMSWDINISWLSSIIGADGNSRWRDGRRYTAAMNLSRPDHTEGWLASLISWMSK